MKDQCSFQEPMARLIKGNHHIDFYHFYNRVDVVDDPCEDRLKQYHKKDFYPFRPCSFMDCRHRVQITLGKCFEYILTVTTWNLPTSARMVFGLIKMV